MQRLFVQRRCHHGVDLTGQGQVSGSYHRLVGGLAGAGLHRADHLLHRIHVGQVQHVDPCVALTGSGDVV
jgi:hypothetical protein